jgi:hypothetical protein
VTRSAGPTTLLTFTETAVLVPMLFQVSTALLTSECEAFVAAVLSYAYV